ncbi:LacI family DNA-binding transcriptional regulator [Gorillibacterium timonense]|uniref:LacI family DNA-binding transcriptional regulator n=1 Tax=Gorillibacterium timonense TaxID=1689269 RepID=UPI00071CD46C|nr:LacI family DNA-binding transcriptional regulator [Gorillibacterium timonense]
MGNVPYLALHLISEGGPAIASILDIAKKAGVSKTTVSKVLNRQYGVHAETRKRVLEAAEALHYTPNIAARSLVMSKSGVIGVVYDSFRSPLYMELATQLEHHAMVSGYRLVFCSCNEDPDAKSGYIRYFMGGAADGIILFGSAEGDEAILDQVTAVDYPCAVIENHVEHLSIPNVLIDNLSGAAQAVDYLYERGHRAIAHVTGNLLHKVAVDRRDGFVKAMEEHGLSAPPERLLSTEGTIGCGTKAAAQLLAMKERPTAVFVFNDLIAYEMMDALHQARCRIPEDLSVVGFDHLVGLLSFKPGPLELTSLSQPLSDVAAAAIDLVAALVAGNAPQEKVRLFWPELKEGNTCRTLPPERASDPE